MTKNLSRAKLVRTGALTMFGLALTLVIGCGSKQEANKQEGSPQVAKRDVSQVMNDHQQELMAIAGVTGVAIGQLDNGTPAILVLVEKDSAAVAEKLPKEVEGHPTKIVVTGKIVPLQGN